YEKLPSLYRQADGFVFASSCENMPNILLEAMASGLPIACSEREPMPELLGDAGVYFDPVKPEAIAKTLGQFLHDQVLRERLAHQAYTRSQAYSWTRCARETFSFLSRVGAGADAG
ncbi:MAG TPA: glycosyltransferase, partial [Bacteroidota bacterium]|nr:glycosyltransferase [Bacteroidota bacterium]